MLRAPGPSNHCAAGLSGPAAFVCMLIVAFAGGCAREDDPGTRAGGGADRDHRTVAIREIGLDLPVAQERAEFSGLDWWGDRLVLLPQYPAIFAPDGHAALPTIPRSRLESYLSGEDTTAIRPEMVPFEDGGLPERVVGWDGYEAIAFDGDRVFLTIECLTHAEWTAVLVRASVSFDPLRIVVDAETRRMIPGASKRPNFTEEASFVVDGRVTTIHELNGRRVNAEPVALRFDEDLVPLGTWTMPAIEYRVTDATSLDAEGRFWVFNQFWPGEARVVGAREDAFATQDRPPGRPVERVVPLRLVDGRIVLDPTRPLVELVLRTDDVARNWEGLARWNDEGLLIVTDRHPRTIFAFVQWQ